MQVLTGPATNAANHYATPPTSDPEPPKTTTFSAFCTTKLYGKQLAKVKIAGSLSEWFSVKKGVRQDCVLSPYLFSILAEMVMRETLDGFQGGLRTEKRMITNLRYADDIILFAISEAELSWWIAYPSQQQIQPTRQRRQDQGNGERRLSVPHAHSE